MNDQYVIETHDLTKYYGNKAVVDHLNVKIPSGSIYGLLGRNGAGKSTTIRMLLGFARPTCGQSYIDGCDCQNLTPDKIAKIGYINEGHKLFSMMKIKELRKYQAAFYPQKWNSELFDEMLDFFELSDKKRIRSLSNGQRAQVSLALTIAPDPEILIMDDPTLGLDVVVRRQFLEGMIKLIQRKGRTILFSSHILSDVERVADRILVMDNGQLRVDCPMEDFRSSVKKIMFHFGQSEIEPEAIPGMLHCRRNEHNVEAVLVSSDISELENWCTSNKVIIESEAEMSLEDQFIEYTVSPKKRQLFSWDKQ